MRHLFYTLSFLLFGSLSVFAQKQDSLWSVWNNSQLHDTVRLEALNNLAWEFIFSKPDSAYKLATIQLAYAEKVKDTTWQAAALNVKGITYWVKGNYDQALEAYDRSATLKKLSGDRKGLAGTYNNIGGVYQAKGNSPKAIEYFLESLKIKEELGNRKGMAVTYHNVGFIYFQQNDKEEALNYYNKSLEIRLDLKDSTGIASTRNNIGQLYFEEQRYRDALVEYEESYKVFQLLGDEKGMAVGLGNIGSSYLNLDQMDSAFDYLSRSFDARMEYGDPKMIARGNYDLGTVYQRMGQSSRARGHCLEGYRLADSIGVLEEIKLNCECLSNAYEALGDAGMALKYYKQFTAVKDTMLNQERTKEITTAALQYEFDKEKLARDLEFQKKEEQKKFIYDQDIKVQKIYTWIGAGGCLLLLLLAGLIWRSYRQKKSHNELLAAKNETISRQKDEVQEQKDIVEEKNRNITDSITYARKLQQAILPTMHTIERHFPRSFMLYKPKDIVAGDFYWLEKKGELVLFAVADCTGHGVPGAMVSVVCSNALNKAVNEMDMCDPGEILAAAREFVTVRLSRNDEGVRDGMDISLCAFNPTTMQLKWAGAFNPLWIIRNDELIEYKANRQHIGKTDTPKSFDTHEIHLQSKDSLYLFTDGFADQFHGETGKKFKSGNFKKLLLNVNKYTMKEQREMIDDYFEKWKEGIEQIDDVCVFGVRV